MKKTFGILGGFGAPAMLHLHQHIIMKTLQTKGHTDLDFPNFIMTNLPENVMTETGIITNLETFTNAISKASNAFNDATDVVVLCNSFHRHYDLMQEHFRGKLIHLPNTVKAEVIKQGYTNPLLVSSAESIRSKLYESDEYTLNTLFHSDIIDTGMKNVTTEQTLQLILQTADKVKADCIITGCTDLANYAAELRTRTTLKIIDSVETAANIITGEIE